MIARREADTDIERNLTVSIEECSKRHKNDRISF